MSAQPHTNSLQPRVALVDVDMTLINNKNSKYNEALIEHLKHYDAVYLITGRNLNDTWQHVLQLGSPPPKWQNQLLFNIKEHLLQQGVKLKAVSTPYDHYLKQTDKAAYPHHIQVAGQACEAFYFDFEKRVANKAKPQQTDLTRAFDAVNGAKLYPDGLGETTKLDEAMPSYLAVQRDTEKKGQVEFLLQKFAYDGFAAENTQVHVFDDKAENLAKIQTVLQQNNFQCQTFEVKAVETYQVPQQLHSVKDSSKKDKTKSTQTELKNEAELLRQQFFTQHKVYQQTQYLGWLRSTGLDKNMSWQQIIAHATGNSYKNAGLSFFYQYGGQRSMQVLLQMGILNHNGDIINKAVLKKIEAETPIQPTF